jgi:hypothetical protein
MQRATYRLPRTASRPLEASRPGSAIENFAIRFAELALLAGLFGAGIALLLTHAG